MKKDIEIPEVSNVFIAAVLEQNEYQETVWNIYIINDKNLILEGVLVTSSGYAPATNGNEIKSSSLRHVVGNIPSKTATKIELITPEVFKIFNEYWVTFFQDNRLMEKKFTFGPHTIDQEFLEPLPVMDVKGILVK